MLLLCAICCSQVSSDPACLTDTETVTVLKARSEELTAAQTHLEDATADCEAASVAIEVTKAMVVRHRACCSHCCWN